MSQPPSTNGLIVVAEQPVYDLLAASGVDWTLQRRVDTVQQMWDDLSSGALSNLAIGLVFSDQNRPLDELADAIVAMSKAGALVFVTLWEPDNFAALRDAVTASAAAQQMDLPDGGLPFHPVAVTGGGYAAMEAIRQAMQSALAHAPAWPEKYPPIVHEPLTLPQAQTPEWKPGTFRAPPGQSIDDAPALPPGMAAIPDIPAVAEAPNIPPTAEHRSAAGVFPRVNDVFAVEPPATPGPHQAPVVTDRAPEGYQHTAPATPPISTPPAAMQAAPTGEQEATGKSPNPHSRPPMPTVAAGAFPEGASAELLARDPIPGGQTITVISSKGGSGKTTVSQLLAMGIATYSRLAGEPKSVVVVDLDVRDGQVAIVFRRWAPSALNLRKMPHWDEQTIRKNLVYHDKYGIHALLAPVRPRDAAKLTPEFYRTIIRSLQRMFDVVVLDCSVAYMDPLASSVALVEATEILMVSTMVETSVAGMGRSLREFVTPQAEGGMGIPKDKIAVVLNQTANNIGMKNDKILENALGVSVIAKIPLASLDVMAATNKGELDVLLRHETLGPAYFRLAGVCLPDAKLSPVVAAPPTTPVYAPAVTAVSSPTPPAQAGNGQLPGLTQPPTPAKRGIGRLFSRG